MIVLGFSLRVSLHLLINMSFYFFSLLIKIELNVKMMDEKGNSCIRQAAFLWLALKIDHFVKINFWLSNWSRHTTKPVVSLVLSVVLFKNNDIWYFIVLNYFVIFFVMFDPQNKEVPFNSCHFCFDSHFGWNKQWYHCRECQFYIYEGLSIYWY